MASNIDSLVAQWRFDMLFKAYYVSNLLYIVSGELLWWYFDAIDSYGDFIRVNC